MSNFDLVIILDHGHPNHGRVITVSRGLKVVQMWSVSGMNDMSDVKSDGVEILTYHVHRLRSGDAEQRFATRDPEPTKKMNTDALQLLSSFYLGANPAKVSQ